jgi:hypothetical protein
MRLMRLGWLALAALVFGCANGLVTDAVDASPIVDATLDRASPPDATVDHATNDANGPDTADVADAFDAGCSQLDAGMGGIGIPANSTATGGSYQSSTPDKAIDGDLGTYWNAGGYMGGITITFPSAQTFSGIRIASVASPGSGETYTITGYQNNTSQTIGTASVQVPAGVSIVAPISVTPGAYDQIRIDVSAGSSWAAIAEVSLLTQYCP